MSTSLLFGNWTAIVPIALSVVFISSSWWLANKGMHAGWSVRKRVAWLRRIRGLVPMLPLSGLFGTIFSLIQTLSYMGEHATSLSAALPEVLQRFAPALSSTLWGIVGAFFSLFLIELSLHQLEEEDA